MRESGFSLIADLGSMLCFFNHYSPKYVVTLGGQYGASGVSYTPPEKLAELENFREASYAQQGEDLVASRCLRQFFNKLLRHGGFYVDCGAHHPVKDSVTKLMHDHGWRGINIDVQIERIDAFKKYRPDDVSLLTAVTDHNGTITMHMPERGIALQSSVDPKIVEFFEERGVAMLAREVPARTLTSILDEHAPNQHIDFLNLDVEGCEMPALMGLDFERYAPSLIAVEVHGSNLDEITKNEVFVLLKSKGYNFVASTVITHFFVKNQA